MMYRQFKFIWISSNISILYKKKKMTPTPQTNKQTNKQRLNKGASCDVIVKELV